MCAGVVWQGDGDSRPAHLVQRKGGGACTGRPAPACCSPSCRPGRWGHEAGAFSLFHTPPSPFPAAGWRFPPLSAVFGGPSQTGARCALIWGVYVRHFVFGSSK